MHARVLKSVMARYTFTVFCAGAGCVVVGCSGKVRSLFLVRIWDRFEHRRQIMCLCCIFLRNHSNYQGEKFAPNHGGSDPGGATAC